MFSNSSSSQPKTKSTPLFVNAESGQPTPLQGEALEQAKAAGRVITKNAYWKRQSLKRKANADEVEITGEQQGEPLGPLNVLGNIAVIKKEFVDEAMEDSEAKEEECLSCEESASSDGRGKRQRRSQASVSPSLALNFFPPQSSSSPNRTNWIQAPQQEGEAVTEAKMEDIPPRP